ncbi:hypothetical protein [Actinomadura flavalba]|uniref:hypothetical protein n=1 Tax=Actinomadura flavalba TaxID=1120938 RepID=UPI00036BD52C|nr:hypothetical protein [Actinomadura flavalba]
MRPSALRIACVAVLGGALIGSTACNPADIVGGSKSEACGNIETELRTLANAGTAPNPSDPMGGAAANAQKFSDVASKIRAEGQKAGGDVASASSAFARDLDSAATTLRNLSSGNLSGGANTNWATQMQQSGQALASACGFSGNRFNIGS